jgi:hypothetical protein
MTVGARHSFSAFNRAFRYQKAATKSYFKPISVIVVVGK